MQHDDLFALLDLACLHHINDAGEDLAGVAGIQDDGFLAGHQVHSLTDFLAGVVVSAAGVVLLDVEVGTGGVAGQAIVGLGIGEVLHDAGFLGIAEGRDGHAGEAQGRAFVPEAAVQTHKSADAANAADDAGVFQTHFLGLCGQLGSAVIVTGHANYAAAADGNEVNLFTVGLVLGSEFCGQLVKLQALVTAVVLLQYHVGAHHTIQQQVGAELTGIVVDAGDGALQAVLSGYGSGEAAVVGLCAAQSQQAGCALIQRVGQQVFQLAQLVAADTQIGQIIALDVKLYAQLFGNSGQILHGSGSVQERNFLLIQRHCENLRLCNSNR